MPTGAQDVANPRLLHFSGRLAIQQLTETKNGIERCPKLVAHSGKKLALRLVRAVGFFLGLAQRGFGRLSFGNVFHHEKEMEGLPLIAADDAGSAAHPEDVAILMNVTLVTGEPDDVVHQAFFERSVGFDVFGSGDGLGSGVWEDYIGISNHLAETGINVKDAFCDSESCVAN